MLNALEARSATCGGRALRAKLREQKDILPAIRVVRASLLNATENVLAHQCNCLTVRSHGLSRAIIDKWSWADAYAGRKKQGTRNLAIESDRPTPGTWCSKFNLSASGPRRVVALFGQWAPGKPQTFPTYPGAELETLDARLCWFYEALTDLLEEMDPKDGLALPYGIGCGLAGGDWDDYSLAIAHAHQTVPYASEIVLYRL